MDISEERVPVEQLAGTSQEPKEEPPKVFKFTKFDDEQARQRLWLGMEQSSPDPEWEQLRRVTENFKTRHVALLLPEDPTETRTPLVRPKRKPKESKNETQRAAGGTLKVDKNVTERIKSSNVETKKVITPKIKKSSPIKKTSENKVKPTTAVEEEAVKPQQPKEKPYDSMAARAYIRKKKLEREKKAAEQAKKEQQVNDEKRAKLEQLRNTQLNIIKKTKKISSQPERPEWVRTVTDEKLDKEGMSHSKASSRSFSTVEKLHQLRQTQMKLLKRSQKVSSKEKPGWVSTLDNPPTNLEFFNPSFLSGSPRGTVRLVNSRGSELETRENPPKHTLSKGSLENLRPLELPEDAVISSDKITRRSELPEGGGRLEPLQSSNMDNLLTRPNAFLIEETSVISNAEADKRDELLKKISSQIEDISKTLLKKQSPVKDTAIQVDGSLSTVHEDKSNYHTVKPKGQENRNPSIEELFRERVNSSLEEIIAKNSGQKLTVEMGQQNSPREGNKVNFNACEDWLKGLAKTTPPFNIFNTVRRKLEYNRGTWTQRVDERPRGSIQDLMMERSRSLSSSPERDVREATPVSSRSNSSYVELKGRPVDRETARDIFGTSRSESPTLDRVTELSEEQGTSSSGGSLRRDSSRNQEIQLSSTASSDSTTVSERLSTDPLKLPSSLHLVSEHITSRSSRKSKGSSIKQTYISPAPLEVSEKMVSSQSSNKKKASVPLELSKPPDNLNIMPTSFGERIQDEMNRLDKLSKSVNIAISRNNSLSKFPGQGTSRSLDCLSKNLSPSKSSERASSSMHVYDITPSTLFEKLSFEKTSDLFGVPSGSIQVQLSKDNTDTSESSLRIEKDLFDYSTVSNIPLDQSSVGSPSLSLLKGLPILDLPKKDSDFSVDSSEMDDIGISKFSLRMFSVLLKDEELRSEHQLKVLKLREKALVDYVKAELAWLEIQRRKSKEKSNDEQVKNIRKKQRGILLKHQNDREEIHRMMKAEKSASQERRLMLIQQQHLVKIQLASKEYYQRNVPQMKSYKTSRMSCPMDMNKFTVPSHKLSTKVCIEKQKRELERREAALLARRQSIETVAKWRRKLDYDENKLLADINNPIHPSYVGKIERGTSPFRLSPEPDRPGPQLQSELPQVLPTSSVSFSQSESEVMSQVSKGGDLYSDSFEQASGASENIQTVPSTSTDQKSGIVEKKPSKSVISIKFPLSPCVTRTKRRHSSGSDESILFSQNETQSEQSDMEVRVSALQQQLKQRKVELDKLKKERNKTQRERLRAKEQSLINQIQAYDSYIEQAKQEIQRELESTDLKIVRPQIKHPRVTERRKSDISITSSIEKKKEDLEVSSSVESIKFVSKSPNLSDVEQPSEVSDNTIKSQPIESVSQSIKTDLDLGKESQSRSEESSSVQEELPKSILSEVKTESPREISEDSVTVVDSAQTLHVESASTKLDSVSVRLDSVKSQEEVATVVSTDESENKESLLETLNDVRTVEEDPQVEEDASQSSIEESQSFNKQSESESQVTSYNLESSKIPDTKELLEFDASEEGSIREEMVSYREPSPPSVKDEKIPYEVEMEVVTEEVSSEIPENHETSPKDEMEFLEDEEAPADETFILKSFGEDGEDFWAEEKEMDSASNISEMDSLESARKPPADKTVDKVNRITDEIMLDILQESFEISEKLWKNNFEEPVVRLTTEETPLLKALQDEKERYNESIVKPYEHKVDLISTQIANQCLQQSADSVLTLYFKRRDEFSTTEEFKNEEAQKVGDDNEGFWLGEGITTQTAKEAELLRLQQLQIEQEIEELEQATEVGRYVQYLREIPNKPPPPYTPPRQSAPSKEELVGRLVEGASLLYDLEQGQPLDSIQELPLPPTYLASLDSTEGGGGLAYRQFMWDLAREIYLKALPRPQPRLPPWKRIVTRRRLPPRIRSKEDLIRYVSRQVKVIFGFEPQAERENFLMRWSRKKRDTVDELIVRESQEEEAEWLDFSQEENLIKNQVGDQILGQVFDEAIASLALAFSRKFKDDNS